MDQSRANTVRMIYTGQIANDTKPYLSEGWYVLESRGFPTIENDGGSLHWDRTRVNTFKKTRPYGCQPGAIFTFDATEDGKSIFPASARDPARWANPEDVVKWEMTHRAAQQKVRERSLAKKLAAKSEFRKLVEPLKDIYGRLSFAEQGVFLVMLVNEFRRRS